MLTTLLELVGFAALTAGAYLLAGAGGGLLAVGGSLVFVCYSRGRSA